MPYLDFLQYSFLGNTIEKYLISIAIFVVFLVGATLLNVFLIKFFSKWAKKTKTQLDDTIFYILSKVAIYIIAIAGIYFGLKTLVIPQNLWEIFEKIIQIVLIVKIIQGISIFADYIIKAYFHRFHNVAKGFDTQMTKMITRIFHVVLWIIGFSMVLQIFGYDITALITGLGIGGLAIALAAQDTLSNFFSSVSIMADKPYKIGDIIRFGTERGVIKDIGFRTTRIETFAGSKLSIPNSEIAKATVENLSKRQSIRYDGQIGITYETSSSNVEKALELLKDILKNEKNITENFRAHFTEFDASALRLEYTYYVVDPLDYQKYLDTKNRINMGIKRAFDKANIDMAYPTQTVHLSK